MRLAVLCSGNGTNFENILRSCWEDEVVIMIHNVENCGAVKRANKFGIPHCYVDSKKESKIINEFKWAGVELVIMAGWMRIVTKQLIEAFPDRIINIHPSLLPKHKGLNVVKRAMDAGDTVTGCTVHYVTEELDSGAIICQAEVPILPDDSVESLTRAIQRQEYSILPEAIKHVKHKIQT